MWSKGGGGAPSTMHDLRSKSSSKSSNRDKREREITTTSSYLNPISEKRFGSSYEMLFRIALFVVLMIVAITNYKKLPLQ